MDRIDTDRPGTSVTITRRRLLIVGGATALAAACGGGTTSATASPAATAAATTAATSAPTAAATAAPALKIGMLLPFTKVYAELGNSMKRATDLYLKQQGGKLSGRSVSVIY